MRILNEEQMWQAVTMEEIMGAVEEAYEIHRLGTYHMPDRYVAQRNQNMMLYMPCFVEDAIGTKMLAEIPGNPAKGLPYLSGLMILNDAETGKPQAIMNGSTITAMRTGAAGGVAVRTLSRPDVHSVGLVGCGVQGYYQLLYACQVREIHDIWLFSPTGKDLIHFVQKLERGLKNPNIRIHVAEGVEELCQNSEVLICCTPATFPVYPNDEKLLKDKCFIAIGSWRPERRELPDAVWKLVDKVYTEMPYALEETGDLRIPLATGLLTEDRVGYMEDLLHDMRRGEAPVLSGTQCFKSVGMGLYDVCTARLIYRKAVEMGIGQEVEW